VSAPVSTQDFDAFFRFEYPKLVAVAMAMTNLAIDKHRSEQRTNRSNSLTDRDNITSFDDPVVDGWWMAVWALPDRQRAVVVLHYIEDRSVLDVARVLGIAEGTVKATLAKARHSLARTLEKES
jgi:DNA-directed RNA polymerase specialized sigma24 family protein